MIKQTLCGLIAALSLACCGENRFIEIGNFDGGISSDAGNFVCKEGEIKTDSCGLNNRGTLETSCVNGQYISGECNNNDVCVDDSIRKANCDNTCIGERNEICVGGQWEKTDCEEIIPVLYYKDKYVNVWTGFEKGKIAIDGLVCDGSYNPLGHEISVIDTNRNNQTAIIVDTAPEIQYLDFKNNRVAYYILDNNSLANSKIGVAEIDNNLNIERRFNINYYDLDLWFYGVSGLNSEGFIYLENFINSDLSRHVSFYDFSNGTNTEIFSSLPDPFGPICNPPFRTPVFKSLPFLNQGISNGFVMLGYDHVACDELSINPPIVLSPFRNYNWQELPIMGFNPRFENSIVYYKEADINGIVNLKAYKPNDLNNPRINYIVVQIGQFQSWKPYEVSSNQILYQTNYGEGEGGDLITNFEIATLDFDNGKICRQSTHKIHHQSSFNPGNSLFSDGQILINDGYELSICRLRPCTLWQDADITRH